MVAIGDQLFHRIKFRWCVSLPQLLLSNCAVAADVDDADDDDVVHEFVAILREFRSKFFNFFLLQPSMMNTKNKQKQTVTHLIFLYLFLFSSTQESLRWLHRTARYSLINANSRIIRFKYATITFNRNAHTTNSISFSVCRLI